MLFPTSTLNLGRNTAFFGGGEADLDLDFSPESFSQGRLWRDDGPVLRFELYTSSDSVRVIGLRGLSSGLWFAVA